MGYTDNKLFDDILKRLDSNWVQLSELPGHANKVHMYESNKMWVGIQTQNILLVVATKMCLISSLSVFIFQGLTHILCSSGPA